MRKVVALALALAPWATAQAQEAYVVQCRVGNEVFESWFEPRSAIGSPGEKVLPMHMVVTQSGDYQVEFRADRPFAMYAYRYEPSQRSWQFLDSSAASRGATDQSGRSIQYWDMRIAKADTEMQDYLFQVQPGSEAQNERHRYQFVQRTYRCG
jgi:hypothetical protein